eukprot:g53257.t1
MAVGREASSFSKLIMKGCYLVRETVIGQFPGIPLILCHSLLQSTARFHANLSKNTSFPFSLYREMNPSPTLFADLEILK